MAQSPDTSLKGLLEIISRTFNTDTSNYQPDEAQLSPIRTMVGQSAGLELIQQNLPNKAGDTKAVQWLLGQMPADANPQSFVEKVKRGVANLPLGGLSEQELAQRRQMRSEDPYVQRYTFLRGEVPQGDTTVPVGDSFRAAAAQNVGAIAADAATDGLRNIWWFLNAPQALASVATLQALHQSGKEFSDPADQSQLLRSRGMRLAATLPAMIGMSMAVGNFGRQPGYTAAVPSEADKTQTADPLAEAGARYFLGRTGSLLPYDEFVKERPDVSKGEYEAYKAYLHGSALPLKATLDGINGPEVTFMGKSIPVLTGVLPAVAAVAGTAYGVRKAGRRLMQQGKLETEAKLLDQAFEASRRPDDERDTSDFTATRKLAELRRNIKEGKEMQGDAQGAFQDYAKVHDANQFEILKQSLLYSSLGLGGTAFAGQTAELIRRSLKGDAAEPEEPVVAVAPAPASPVKPQGQPRS